MKMTSIADAYAYSVISLDVAGMFISDLIGLQIGQRCIKRAIERDDSESYSTQGPGETMQLSIGVLWSKPHIPK